MNLTTKGQASLLSGDKAGITSSAWTNSSVTINSNWQRKRESQSQVKRPGVPHNASALIDPFFHEENEPRICAKNG